MLHIITLLERRFPRRSPVRTALLLISLLALLAGVIVFMAR